MSGDEAFAGYLRENVVRAFGLPPAQLAAEGADELATWLRQRIKERLYLATHAIELGNAAVWEETSSGVLVTGEPTETDCWHGTWPMGDSSLTRLMEANDPRDTIARCEFELAVLDEFEAYWRLAVAAWEAEAGVHSLYDQARTLKRTVRRLGYSYRFKDGYRQEWKP